jgi:hypothetical protein
MVHSGATRAMQISDRPPSGHPPQALSRCPNPRAGGTATGPFQRSSRFKPRHLERGTVGRLGDRGDFGPNPRQCGSSSALQAMRFVHRLPLFARTLP